jgi:hypothetical protein
MNTKKYWLSAAAVFIIARSLVAFLFFGLIFDSVYDQPINGMRAEGEELFGPAFLVTFLWSLAFVYIFAKGYQNKGIPEGLRFGLLTWIFYFVPMIVCYWSYFELPADWLMASLASGFAESLVAGLCVAFIYKTKTVTTI